MENTVFICEFLMEKMLLMVKTLYILMAGNILKRVNHDKPDLIFKKTKGCEIMPPKKLRRNIDIIGVGSSISGLADKTDGCINLTTRELWAEAAAAAIKDSGLPHSAIEALYIGNMQSSYNEGQYHLGYVLGMCNGLEADEGIFKSAVGVEGACASSSHAIRAAVFAVASGAYDVVIAGGVEQGNTKWDWTSPGEAQSMNTMDLLTGIFAHLDQGWEVPQMNMLDHVMSQWLLAYAKHYHLSKEQLLKMLDARVITNWTNGLGTPELFWNPPIEEMLKQFNVSDIHELLASPKINPVRNWPIRRWDYMRRVDGASAVVICAADVSKNTKRIPIHYLGTGNALQQYALSRDMYRMPFVEEAGKQAYSMSGLMPSDINIVEMYDFGPAEYFLPLEDLGFWGRGESYERAISGSGLYSGDKPVNPSSGGSTCGCVSGAIGAASIGHLVRELRCEAGAKQVKPQPKIGMAYDCGGARNCVIHILGR